MNPIKLLQMKTGWENFKSIHPKFLKFLRVISRKAITEGTVIAIDVTAANGEKYSSNIRLTASDLELLVQVKEMLQEVQ